MSWGGGWGGKDIFTQKSGSSTFFKQKIWDIVYYMYIYIIKIYVYIYVGMYFPA